VEGTSSINEKCPVPKCRLNQIQNTKGMDEMIPRLWLAAFLGVFLGVGMAYATSVPVVPVFNMNPTAQTFEVARPVGATAQRVQVGPQLVLVSLLVGIIVATPAFLIVRRRA